MADGIEATEVERILKRYRRRRLRDDVGEVEPLDIGQEELFGYLPQRPPMLFVGRISGIARDSRALLGTRALAPSDIGFEGHFPGAPIYPGTFQIEMLGQLGLCLFRFLDPGAGADAPPPIRATRVLGARFLAPLVPGDTVELCTQVLQSDGYFATAVGQATVRDAVACVSVAEVMFLYE